MRDISCNLLSTSIQSDSIGVEKEITTQIECPIIKVEDVYAKEFYEANEQGHQPSLRLRISTLNYSNQKELVYMGTTYSVIRVDDQVDEIVLVCERKVKNV